MSALLPTSSLALTTELLADVPSSGVVSLSDLQERRLGRDLVLPLDPDDELRVTPTGDLPTVAGRENVRAALRRRTLIAPGTLVHRAEYGGGLTAEVGQPSSPANRSRLANDVRRNLLRDPRVEEARVGVAQGTPGSPSRWQAITAELAIRIRGDQEGQEDPFTVSFAE